MPASDFVQGCLFCPDLGGDHGTAGADLVTGAAIQLLPSGSLTTDGSGQAVLRSASTTDGGAAWTAPPGMDSAAITLCFVVRPEAIADYATYMNVAYHPDQWTTPFHAVGAARDVSTTDMYVARANGGASDGFQDAVIAAGLGTHAPTDPFVVFSVVISDAETKVYKDGSLVASVSGLTGRPTIDPTTTLNLFNRNAGATGEGIQGDAAFAGAWDYAFSNAQASDFASSWQGIPDAVAAAQANTPPTLDSPIADQAAQDGVDTALTFDLSTVFSDADGDALTYAASSDRSAVATTDVSGSTLTVTIQGPGVCTITYSADDGTATTSGSFSLDVEIAERDKILSAGSVADLIETRAPSVHDHDDLYYTEAEIDALPISHWSNDAGYITGVTEADVRQHIDGLGDLADVDLTTVAPEDGDALVFDGAAGTWGPGTVSGGGASAAGPNRAIQYADADGALKGISDFRFVEEDGRLILDSGFGELQLQTGYVTSIVSTGRPLEIVADNIELHGNVRFFDVARADEMHIGGGAGGGQFDYFQSNNNGLFIYSDFRYEAVFGVDTAEGQEYPIIDVREQGQQRLLVQGTNNGGARTGINTGAPTSTLSVGATSGQAWGLLDLHDPSGNVLVSFDLQGMLTLAGDPTAALHAATKQYVDDAVAAAGGGGTGDIESVTAGTGLTGGGTSGDVTLDLDETRDVFTTAGGVKVFEKRIAERFATGANDTLELNIRNLSDGTNLGELWRIRVDGVVKDAVFHSFNADFQQALTHQGATVATQDWVQSADLTLSGSITATGGVTTGDTAFFGHDFDSTQETGIYTTARHLFLSAESAINIWKSTAGESVGAFRWDSQADQFRWAGEVNIVTNADTGSILGGLTKQGRLKADSTDAPPADASAPAAWLNVVVGPASSPTTYKLPLYQ